MRISGGSARGIPLKVPREGTRPATDFLREALFSSLGPLVEGARVLDLFCGSGAYGLECLSRGAARATLVELHHAPLRCAQENIRAVAKSMGVETAAFPADLRQADALQWTPAAGSAYDIILIDPPWDLLESHGYTMLARAASWLADKPQARLVLETPGDYEPPPPPGMDEVRTLGKGKRQPAARIYAPA